MFQILKNNQKSRKTWKITSKIAKNSTKRGKSRENTVKKIQQDQKCRNTGIKSFKILKKRQKSRKA